MTRSSLALLLALLPAPALGLDRFQYEFGVFDVKGTPPPPNTGYSLATVRDMTDLTIRQYLVEQYNRDGGLPVLGSWTPEVGRCHMALADRGVPGKIQPLVLENWLTMPENVTCAPANCARRYGIDLNATMPNATYMNVTRTLNVTGLNATGGGPMNATNHTLRVLMDVAGETASESSLPGPCVCVQGGCAGGFVQNATLHFASPFADGRSGAGYRLRGPELVFAEKVTGGAPQGGYGPFAAGRNPGLWYRSVTFAPTPAPSPAPVVVGAPEVSIVDAAGVPLSQVVLRVADEFVAIAEGRPDTCTSVPAAARPYYCGSNQVEYEWSISPPLAAGSGVDMRKRTLRLPGGLLAPCVGYNLTVRGLLTPTAANPAPSKAGWSQINLLAREGPVLVEVAGGVRRSLRPSEFFALDAVALARDLDTPRASATPPNAGFKYEWECQDLTGGAIRSCFTRSGAVFGATVLETSDTAAAGVINMTSADISLESTFRFNAKGTKRAPLRWLAHCMRSPFDELRDAFRKYERRDDSASVELTVRSAEVPTVLLSRSSLRKVTADRKLLLQGTLQSDAPVLDVRWVLKSCTIGEYPLLRGTPCGAEAQLNFSSAGDAWRRSFVTEPRPLEAGAPSSADTDAARAVFSFGAASASGAAPIALSLGLRPRTLYPGRRYVFGLYGESARGVGFAEMEVWTNLEPQGGELQHSPSKGVALTTAFRLWTTDWTDDDLPLQYTFAFVPNATLGAPRNATIPAVGANATAQEKAAAQAAADAEARFHPNPPPFPEEASFGAFMPQRELGGVRPVLPSGTGPGETLRLLAYARDRYGAVGRCSKVLEVKRDADTYASAKDELLRRLGISKGAGENPYADNPMQREDAMKYFLAVLSEAARNEFSTFLLTGLDIMPQLVRVLPSLSDAPELRDQVMWVASLITATFQRRAPGTSNQLSMLEQVLENLAKVLDFLVSPLAQTQNDPLGQIGRADGLRIAAPMMQPLSQVLKEAYRQGYLTASAVRSVSAALDAMVSNVLAELEPPSGAIGASDQPSPLLLMADNINMAIRTLTANALQQQPAFLMRLRRPDAAAAAALSPAATAAAAAAAANPDASAVLRTTTADALPACTDGDAAVTMPRELAAALGPPQSQVAIAFTVFGMQMHRAGSQHGVADVALIAADEYALSDSVRMRTLVRCGWQPTAAAAEIAVAMDGACAGGWRDLRRSSSPVLLQLPIHAVGPNARKYALDPGPFNASATAAETEKRVELLRRWKRWVHAPNDVSSHDAQVTPDPRAATCARWRPNATAAGLADGLGEYDDTGIFTVGIRTSSAGSVSLVCGSLFLGGEFAAVRNWQTTAPPQAVIASVLSGANYNEPAISIEGTTLPLVVFCVLTAFLAIGAAVLDYKDWRLRDEIDRRSRRRFMEQGELKATDWETVFVHDDLTLQWKIAMTWLHFCVAPFKAPKVTRAVVLRSEHLLVFGVVFISFFYVSAMTFDAEQFRKEQAEKAMKNAQFFSNMTRAFVTACMSYPLAVGIPKLYRWARYFPSITFAEKPWFYWANSLFFGDDDLMDRPQYNFGTDLIRVRASAQRKFRSALRKIRVRKMEHFGITVGKFKKMHRHASIMLRSLCSVIYVFQLYGIAMITLVWPSDQVMAWITSTLGAVVICAALIVPLHAMMMVLFKGFKTPNVFKTVNHTQINERVKLDAVVRQHGLVHKTFDHEHGMDDMFLQGTLKSAEVEAREDADLEAALHSSLGGERAKREALLKEAEDRMRRVAIFDRLAAVEGIFECFVAEDVGGIVGGAAAVLLLLSENELLVTTADRERRALKSAQWAAVHGKNEKGEDFGMAMRERMMERVVLRLDAGRDVLKLQLPSAGPLLEAMARFGGTQVTGPLGHDQETADAFTFDDPSGKFPDEVGLRVGAEGVQVMDRTGRDHLVNMPDRVLRTWSWKKITHVRVSNEHGADVLLVYIRGMGAFGFEMEATEGFRALFDKYQAWAESGVSRQRAVGEAEKLADAVRQARADIAHANRELDLIVAEEDAGLRKMRETEKELREQQRRERVLKLRDRRASKLVRSGGRQGGGGGGVMVGGQGGNEDYLLGQLQKVRLVV